MMLSQRFLFFLAITIVRQIPHLILERRTRRKEIKISKGQLTTNLMYFIYIVIWLSCLYFVYLGDIYFRFLTVIGSILLIVGIALRFASLLALRKNFSSKITIFQNHRLITTGPYRLVRHPLHLALMIEFLGMIVFAEAWPLLLLLMPLYLIIIYRNEQEDLFLVKTFGQEAENYQRNTPPMNIFKGLKHYYKIKNPH